MDEASAGLQKSFQEQALFPLQKLCDPNIECTSSENCIFPFLILNLLHGVSGRSILNVSSESQHQTINQYIIKIAECKIKRS